MEIDPDNLPQDAATLRCLVASLLEVRSTQERRIRQLQHMLEQLLRARYGPRRERVNENQLFPLMATSIPPLMATKNSPTLAETYEGMKKENIIDLIALQTSQNP